MRGAEIVARNGRMKVNMDREGLPFNAERNMSYNSRLAQELGKWAETHGRAEEIGDALYRAYFVDVRNIGKADVLAKIAEENGLPADEATMSCLAASIKMRSTKTGAAARPSASMPCRHFSPGAI